ncbi:MAG TPA: four helix bundle protein [Longimicrobiales bacterium]|nr:four helix bundle protein [Longimicrobiales bacterium]
MSSPVRRAYRRAMGFEKMRVYQAALLLDAEACRLIVGIGRGYGDDVNQLLRALGSILFNIAEAYGSDTVGRKRYHLQVARASSDESRSVLQRLAARGAFDGKSILKACSLTSAIAKMLTAWMDRLPPD